MIPKMTMDLSFEAFATVERCAQRQGVSQRKAWRRILSLINVANRAHHAGHRLGVIEEHPGQLSVIASLIGV